MPADPKYKLEEAGRHLFVTRQRRDCAATPGEHARIMRSGFRKSAEEMVDDANRGADAPAQTAANISAKLQWLQTLLAALAHSLTHHDDGSGVPCLCSQCHVTRHRMAGVSNQIGTLQWVLGETAEEEFTP